MFNFRRANPDPNSEFTGQQIQTWADCDTAREARCVCKVLSNPHTHNTPQSDALRGAVGGRRAEYLYSRFASELGWESLGDAQRYYDQNKGSKGGWR